MKRVIIKAIFKGQDGSCGYKHGMEYELTLWQHSESGHRNLAIELSDINLENYCEYGSVLSLLENWDCIRVVKHIKD